MSEGMYGRTFRDAVREKLEEWSEAAPVYKVMIIVQLRSMFDRCTLDEALDAIDTCNTEWQLKVLLGVGMKGHIYYKTVKRLAELKGV